MTRLLRLGQKLRIEVHNTYKMSKSVKYLIAVLEFDK